MKAPKKNCAGLQNRRRKQTKVRPTIGRFTKKTTQLRTRKRKRSERTERNFWCSICHFALGHVDLFERAVVTVATLGNLRTTTTTLSTTTGSELQCTAQARPVNFVVVVSSTTPNKVESRRPAIHKLRQV